MQQTPKEKPDEEFDRVESDDKERGYYYDDAHGYERYVPELDDDEDEQKNRAIVDGPAD